MNPFEPPQSEIAIFKSTTKVDWTGLAIASVIFVVGVFVLDFSLDWTYLNATNQLKVPIVILVPCCVGAIVLGMRPKTRWIATGLVFSTIPTIESCIELILAGWNSKDLVFRVFVGAILCQLPCTLVALISILCVRIILVRNQTDQEYKM